MATIALNRKQDKVLNDFAREYQSRTLSYLQKTYSLSKEDSEDVFQEASIVLYRAAIDGKLDDLTSSLYTYFIGICNNKAHEQLRAKGKAQIVYIEDYSVEANGERYNTLLNKAEKLLDIIDKDEKRVNERDGIVQDMVKQLPPPCDKLLWSYYRDALSMKVIAQMFHYASESVAKVTKHRCQEKFRKNYEVAVRSL